MEEGELVTEKFFFFFLEPFTLCLKIISYIIYSPFCPLIVEVVGFEIALLGSSEVYCLSGRKVYICIILGSDVCASNRME